MEIRVGNEVRYILDIDAIDLAKKTPGEIMNVREAASMAGVPVSVLEILRQSGHFIVEHMPKYNPGFHETDLRNFSQKLLQKSNIITAESISNHSCFSLDYILQKKKFWSNTGKANFVAAYLDGIIQSVGRTGDSPEHIWFHKTDVETSASISRTETYGRTISQQEAAKVIGCDMAIIPALIENKHLIGQSGPNRNRVSHESAKQFASLYVPLSSLADQLSTSSRRLLKLCRKSEIDVLCMPRKQGVIAPFIKHEAQKELLEQVRLNPTRAQKREISRQNHTSSLAKLKHYFDHLRENDIPLPRRALLPNICAIAAASGIVRDVFYYNPEAVAMLEAFATEERELKGIKKRDDIGDLQHYLKDLKRNKAMLPRLKNGQPNKVAIAKTCGINRNIFYSSPEAAAILEKHATEMHQNDKHKQRSL